MKPELNNVITCIVFQNLFREEGQESYPIWKTLKLII